MNLTLRRTGGNALSILTSDAMNRVTSFVLYALVARYLGAQAFGQLALAFTLFYAFQVCSVAGLKTMIVRQVAKDRGQTSRYFANAAALVVITSFLSYVVLYAFVRMAGYPAETAAMALLLALGLLPYAISAVCEGIFQAWERMHYIAFIQVPMNALKVAGAAYLLWSGQGLRVVVLVVLAGLVATAGLELWILFRHFPRQRASIEPRSSFRLLRTSCTFMGIDATIAFSSGLNVLLLSLLASEVEVGLYSAAMQVMVPLALVFQSVGQSIFPLMCRSVESGLPGLKRIAANAVSVLLVLAMPAVVMLLFAGDALLTALYKDPVFLQAYPVLQITSWILILQAFTSVLGQVLWATDREYITLRIVVVTLLLNLVAGWFLILHFGLMGAAATVLLTRAAGWVQHYIPVSRLFSGIDLGRIAWKPALAAALMTAYLALPDVAAGLLDGLTAALIYAGALLALGIYSAGGFHTFKARYIHHLLSSQE